MNHHLIIFSDVPAAGSRELRALLFADVPARFWFSSIVEDVPAPIADPRGTARELLALA